jgi:hypothetical protein
MVSWIQNSIRAESAELCFAKEGWTALYVNQNSDAASDDNDGFSWDRPCKTIQGAIDKADTWAKIFIAAGGTYLENVVIDTLDKIKLIGAVQDGLTRSAITPTSGVPLTIETGYCEAMGLALVSTNNHALKLEGPGHYMHDMYVEVNNSAATVYYGEYLNDADACVLENIHHDGHSSENVIGTYVGGGSVDVGIIGNYYIDWGDSVKPGYAIGVYDAQRVSIVPRVVAGHIIPNRFISNYLGVLLSPQAGYRGHCVHGNGFWEQVNYDGYDTNDQDISGNRVDGNFYGYTDWFRDLNHDGIGDLIVTWGGNKDFHPLAGLQSWRTPPMSRTSVI